MVAVAPPGSAEAADGQAEEAEVEVVVAAAAVAAAGGECRAVSQVDAP